MSDLIPPQTFPGLIPYLCEHDGPDGRYGIILHGSDPAQIVKDNAAELPGLTVMGEHGGTVMGGDNG